MRRNGMAIILIALVVLYSCNTKRNENPEGIDYSMDCLAVAKCESAPMASEVAPDLEALKPAVKNNSFIKKKIIKDGEISVETKDVNASKKSIDEKLKKLNAYYENEELLNVPERISYNLRIRVPAANFEKLISDIENGNGEVRHKNIKARDVTEEYM